MINANSKKLVCFDFDETIVDGHLHNFLFEKGAKPGQGEEKHLDEFLNTKGFKNKDKTLLTFQRILAAGHNIAITSFTLYPEMILPALKKLGLSEEALSQILIIGGFPSKKNPETITLTGKGGLNPAAGKSLHMQKAMEHFDIEERSNVILVDDSGTNIAKAKEDKYVAIKAPRDSSENLYYGDYLEKLLTTLELDNTFPEPKPNPLAQTMRFAPRKANREITPSFDLVQAQSIRIQEVENVVQNSKSNTYNPATYSL